MKRLVADPTKCKGCGTCEETCSKAFFKKKCKEKSAIRVTANEQGGYTIAVCDQCGDCMGMCSAMALSRMPNGMVRLDKRSCVGCLVCVGECLRDFMFYHDDLPVPFKCNACGLCVKHCPEGVLSIANS